MTVPNIEPKALTVGESVEWQRYLQSYLPTDGWGLFYSFRNFKAGFDVAASPKVDHYHVSLSSKETTLYKAGTYWWQATLTRDGSDDWHIVDEGSLLVKENLALTKKYDGRSHVKQVLDALESTILGKASRDQMGYSIAGRSISRLSPAELLKWRDLYKAEYAREASQERLNQGLGSGSIIKVRF
jgi:hypothetical protein